METRIEINSDARVFPGDKLEFRYEIWGGNKWLRALQQQTIEKAINKDPRFFLYSVKTDDVTGEYIYTIIVVMPEGDAGAEAVLSGVPVKIVVVAVAAAASSLLLWLSLSKISKIVETPAGAVMGAGVGVAAAVIALLFFMKR